MAEISRPKVDVGRPAWSTTSWSNISGVDPRLRDIMENAAVQFAKENPGYSVVGISGKKGRKSGTTNHPGGWAVDVDIVDPTGKHLGNFQDAKSFRTYEKFGQIARAYQEQFHPDLHRDFRAGMYFSGKYHHDQMHFDINPKWHGAMAYGSWEGGLTKAGRRALPGAESLGMNAFPPAPPGPTAPETGPGMYGALSAADLAQSYAAAGNRRAYEQGVRPAPTAIPAAAFSPQQGPPISAMERPQQGPPMSAMQSPTMSNMLSGMDNPVYGPGQIAPSGPSVADLGGRVGTGAFTAAPDPARFGTPSFAPTRTPSPDMRYGGPATNVVANTPMAGINMANASLLGPVLGGATLTPGMVGVPMKQAAAPPSVTPTPTARPDYNAPAAQTPAPAPAAAVPSAYPDEARFSMKPGLTPAEKEQIGLTQPPAPAFTKPPTEVATQKVAAVQPVREQVVKTKTVAPAPAIAPAAPPAPSGFFAALQNAVEPMAAPFHTLANLAGPTPNPPSRNIGTGSAAISSVLSGQAQAGDTAYSRSMPGFSVKDLGNGMVQKTNPFGHVSFEHVDKLGGGMLSGQPASGGFLSNFGLGGLTPTAGGLLSARNLGALAGGVIGGLPGAVAGGFLGNMIGGGTGFGNTANVGPNAFGYAGPWGSGMAPASSGGLFGGFGGGGTSSSSGGKRGGGGKSSGGGATGMSHSTRL